MKQTRQIKIGSIKIEMSTPDLEIINIDSLVGILELDNSAEKVIREIRDEDITREPKRMHG